MTNNYTNLDQTGLETAAENLSKAAEIANGPNGTPALRNDLLNNIVALTTAADQKGIRLNITTRA